MPSVAKTPNGNETHIRAIVFRDGDGYVAQCLEYDIAAQAADIASLLDRLDLTVEAEFDACALRDKEPRECISPAPPYYHGLWEKRAVSLTRINVASPSYHLDVALKAA